MPEAAVNENHGFVFRKNDIGAEERTRNGRRGSPRMTRINANLPGTGFRGRGRRTRRFRHLTLDPLPGRGGEGNWNADMEAEAVAHAVEELANDNFGRRILAADAAHVPGPAFFCETVTHNRGSMGRMGSLLSRIRVSRFWRLS